MKSTLLTSISVLLLSQYSTAIKGKRTTRTTQTREKRVKELEENLGDSLKNAVDRISSSIENERGLHKIFAESNESDEDYKYYYDYRYESYLKSGKRNRKDNDDDETTDDYDYDYNGSNSIDYDYNYGKSTDYDYGYGESNSKDRKGRRSGDIVSGSTKRMEGSGDYDYNYSYGDDYGYGTVPKCESGGYVWSGDDYDYAPVLSPSIDSNDEEVTAAKKNKHSNKRGRKRDLHISYHHYTASHHHDNSSAKTNTSGSPQLKRKMKAVKGGGGKSVKLGIDKEKAAKTVKIGKEDKKARLCKRPNYRSNTIETDDGIKVIRDYSMKYATVGQYRSSSQYSSSSTLSVSLFSVGVCLIMSSSLAYLYSSS